MLTVNSKELIRTLASLYSDKENAEFLIGFSSLDVLSIDFNGSPLMMWKNIIEEASKSSTGIKEIVEGALSEYKDNEVLQAALSQGVELNMNRAESSKEYIPFKNILKNINKDNFGEIRRVDCNRSEQVKQYYKSAKEDCRITYTIGTNKDKPNSFAERMMLQTLESSSNVDSGDQNCWIYRKPNGDRRVDEIPFEIIPDLEASKKEFCKQIESLLKGLNMDKVKEYFAGQNYKSFSLAINYNYALGDDILEAFTEWIYNTFTAIPDTKFDIFFVFIGVQSLDALQKQIDEIHKSLKEVKIVPIKVAGPVSDFDIDTWKGQINLETYTQKEFIEDLTFLKVSETEINDYKTTKKLTMHSMELFQNSLYDAFYKNQ